MTEYCDSEGSARHSRRRMPSVRYLLSKAGERPIRNRVAADAKLMGNIILLEGRRLVFMLTL